MPVRGAELIVGSRKWLGVTAAASPSESRLYKAVDVTPEGLSFHFKFTGVFAEVVHAGAESFTRLALPDGGVSGAVGSPELPVYRKLLRLPMEGEYTLLVKTEGGHAYDLNNENLSPLLFPRQRVIPKVSGALAQVPLEMRGETYRALATTVPEAASLREIGCSCGRRLFLLEVAPVLYDSAEGQIKVLQSVDVEVSASVKQTFEVEHRSEPSAMQRLLIVVADGLLSDLDDFVEAKKSGGWTVDVVAKSGAGSSPIPSGISFANAMRTQRLSLPAFF